MTGRGAIWAAGLAGSVLLHGALVALLVVAIRPDPVTDQQMPQSRLDVQAYRLERQSTQERRPEGAPARQGEAGGAALAAGAIPQARAAAVAHLPAQSAAVAQLAAQRLAPDPARPEIAPAVSQAAAPLASAVPQAAVLDRMRPGSARLDAGTTRPEQAMPQRAPQVIPALATAAAPTPATALAAPRLTLPQSEGPAPRLPEARPEAAALAQTAPRTARLKAALAFQGGDGGDVDPVSLAAFQSFVRPGDAGAGAEALRDGVAGLLAQVPCSRLQVGFDPGTATLQVNGHIPEGDLRAPVLAALQAQMGTDIAVSDNILILPRPQCGALTGIADVGLPQSTDQITNPLLIGADTFARVLSFVKDQRLHFDITAPDYDAWVYVDYFDAGGNVLHLAPNDQVPLRRASAQSALRIGSKAAGDPGLQILIGPPYGQEIAVAFAASAPLYDGLRPLIEPAAPYLDWLKARVAAARADDADFKGEWVYFFVTTAAK